MPGRNLWNDEPDSFQDKRIPNFDSVDPNLKPMSQDAFNAGFEYQLRGNAMLSVNYAHTNLRRTIEDLGVLVARLRGIQVRQPRRRHCRDDEPVRVDAGVQYAEAEAAV